VLQLKHMAALVLQHPVNSDMDHFVQDNNYVDNGSNNEGSKNDAETSVTTVIKKPSSAWIMFSTEYRKQLADESKENAEKLSFKDAAKAIAEKYKLLTAEEKQKYEDLARMDKERYVRECEAAKLSSNFNPNQQSAAGECIFPLVGTLAH
jgi:hypothetical protein